LDTQYSIEENSIDKNSIEEKEPKKPTGLSGNPKEPKKADNDSDNKNDNDSDSDNVKEDIYKEDIYKEETTEVVS
jgi:hypothetical protein